jgi:hypothetical protein
MFRLGGEESEPLGSTALFIEVQRSFQLAAVFLLFALLPFGTLIHQGGLTEIRGAGMQSLIPFVPLMVPIGILALYFAVRKTVIEVRRDGLYACCRPRQQSFRRIFFWTELMSYEVSMYCPGDESRIGEDWFQFLKYGLKCKFFMLDTKNKVVFKLTGDRHLFVGTNKAADFVRAIEQARQT